MHIKFGSGELVSAEREGEGEVTVTVMVTMTLEPRAGGGRDRERGRGRGGLTCIRFSGRAFVRAHRATATATCRYPISTGDRRRLHEGYGGHQNDFHGCLDIVPRAWRSSSFDARLGERLLRDYAWVAIEEPDDKIAGFLLCDSAFSDADGFYLRTLIVDDKAGAVNLDAP